MHIAELSKSAAVRLALALLVCCLALVWPSGGAGAEMSPSPLRLVAGQERYEVGPHLEILPDPDNRWTVEEVSSPSFASAFSPVHSLTLNLGITKTTVWLRFAVFGNPPGLFKGPRNVPWLLDIGWPFFDTIDSYLVRPAAPGAPGKIEKFSFGGMYHPFQGGIAEKTGIVVRLPDLSAQEQVVYLKLRSNGVFFLHPVVCRVKNYLETSIRQMLGFGLYFGILLSLILYNLFLYFGLRDRSYLWYVTSIAAVGAYFFFTSRLTYEYMVDITPCETLRGIVALMAIALLTLVLFARCFLATWDRAPLLDRLIRCFLWVQAVALFLVPFAEIVYLNHWYTVSGGLVWLLIMPAAWSCWRRGYRPARFLIFSWIFYGASAFVYALTFQGILPYSGLSIHSLQIGSGLEAVLLSFALADRINLLRREREELRRSERRHRELAITDTLTGLYNLRYFRAQIDLELELADRLGQKLTLMMLDVDYFKLFNDRYGHPEGDRVLATLGRIMSSCVREKDIPCRYGGEEFAIILPGGQNSTAVEIYERINVELARHRFGSAGEEAGRVTLSIGVAEHIRGEGAETLLRRADQALYEAKERGRNQIIIASREPAAAFFACISEPAPEDRPPTQTLP